MILTDIEVVYTDSPDDKPEDSIEVISEGSDDINKGHQGKYVWLIPKYDTGAPVRTIRLIFTSEEIGERQDLAKGTGGEYIYLELPRSPEPCIGEVKLLRRTEETSRQEVESLGYYDYSENINKNRGGDFLYIIWQSA